MRNKYLLICTNVGAVWLLVSLYKPHLHFYLRVVHGLRLVVRINCLLQNILSVDCILARLVTWSVDLNLYPCGWGFSLCMWAWVVGVKQAKKWLSFLCLNSCLRDPFLVCLVSLGEILGKRIGCPVVRVCLVCDSFSQYPLSNLCGQIFLLIERILIVPLLFLVLSFEAHHLLIVLSVSHFFFFAHPFIGTRPSSLE